MLRAIAETRQEVDWLIVGRRDLPESERGGVPIPARLRFESYLPAAEFALRVEDAPFVVLPLPERDQSLGQLTVLFCMAMARAVIATRVMGVEDYVADGETGLLVPPGDAGALAEAVNRLLAEPDNAAAMGRAGYRRYREHFTDDVMGRRWEDAVSDLLAGRR
ncbi:MAG: glycosyltransferase [Deltaproteobacteria bacterium]|nr:glycosyltransferase [Deltaproteobacteria bacterium]